LTYLKAATARQVVFFKHKKSRYMSGFFVISGGKRDANSRGYALGPDLGIAVLYH